MKFNPILVLLAAALLGSCTKNEVTPAGSETNSINAIMENDATKTNVTDEGYFTWSTGDQIWLHTTGGGIVGTLSSGAGTANAKFSYGSYFGTMTDRAVYPYHDNHDISGNTLSVVLPDTYNLGANTNNTNAAMYAVVSNGNLKFNHLAGVMRFEFKNAPAGTNQFKITLDKKINGTFNADITQSYPTIIASETNVDAEKTITFNFNALEETSDLRIYVPLPVGEYGKLELELNTATETVWSYSKNVNNVIARRGLLRMPTVTMGGSIGGDIENGGDVGGDIENENLYIRFTNTDSNEIDLGYININETSTSSVSLETNVTDFTVEIPEFAQSWVEAHVFVEPNLHITDLVVTISPNTGNERSSYVILKATDNPDVFVKVTFTQEENPNCNTLTFDNGATITEFTFPSVLGAKNWSKIYYNTDKVQATRVEATGEGPYGVEWCNAFTGYYDTGEVLDVYFSVLNNVEEARYAIYKLYVDTDNDRKFDEGEDYCLIKFTQAGASSKDEKYLYYAEDYYPNLSMQSDYARIYSNYLPEELEIEIDDAIKDFLNFNIYTTERPGLLVGVPELIGEPTPDPDGYSYVIIKSKATGEPLLSISLY